MAAGRQHPLHPRDIWTTALLAIPGVALMAAGAYALRSVATLAGTLFFFGLALFVLAAFEPRLRGQVTLGPRGLKFDLGSLPSAPGVEADKAAQIMTADAGQFPSFTQVLQQMLVDEPSRGRLCYAIIDLATGWLDTRLFVLAALFDRARGARCLVFLDGPDRYVGIADIRAVRWALATERTGLESALIAALASAFRGWWPLVDAGAVAGWSIGQGTSMPALPEQVDSVGPAVVGSLSGAIEPRYLMGEVLHEYLRALRLRPAPAGGPPPGWVELRTDYGEAYWEHAGWVNVDRLRGLLGDALVDAAIHEDQTGAVELDAVLRWRGPVVPVIDSRGGFVKGIDREATAATIGTKRGRGRRQRSAAGAA
jgi:hypothetical protein